MGGRMNGDGSGLAEDDPPEDVPSDAHAYRLYVIEKIRQGVEDLDTGRTISSEELARDVETW